MSDFILYSGIVAFLFMLLTVSLKFFRKKPRWHKPLGYSTFIIASIHGSVALYKTIRLYIMYS